MKGGVVMNHKGVTLIELLIVVVVIGIIAAFSLVLVGNVIENSRQSAFVNTATTMKNAASKAYSKNDDLWNDNVATLQELIDNDYMYVDSTDPWGESYDMEDSKVTIGLVVKANEGFYLSNSSLIAADSVYQVKLVSLTATIGFDAPLSEFDNTDIVFLNSDHGGGGINGIIQTITGNSNGPITGDNDNDSITIENSAGTKTDVNTFDGDDEVSVGVDMQGNSSINTGAGNDTVTISRDTKANSVINTGEGDDTINVDRWLRGRTEVDAGSGNDTINIGEIRYYTKTYAGAGNDTLTVGSILHNFRGVIDMGAGDDTLTITDGGTPFSGVNATFTGGEGNDTLTLTTVDTARWNQIKHMFTGFETIILTDGTINN